MNGRDPTRKSRAEPKGKGEGEGIAASPAAPISDRALNSH